MMRSVIIGMLACATTMILILAEAAIFNAAAGV